MKRRKAKKTTSNTRKRKASAAKAAATRRIKLARGAEVEVGVQQTGRGYLVFHRLRGRKTVTVTCTCAGKGSVTKTCTYPAGTPPSPLCICTGKKPRIVC